MKFVPVAVAAALVASPGLAQQPADPARLALAQQVVGLVFPASSFNLRLVRLAESMTGFAEGHVMSEELTAAEAAGPAAPPHGPALDPHELRASLTRAVDVLAPSYQAAVADAFARRFTGDQLRDMLAFFTSPDGATALARRKAWSDRDAAAPAPGVEAAATPPYVETKAERAFDASPTGVALKRAQDEIGREATQVLQTHWPAAMVAARDDYCARQPCGEAERKVFAVLGRIWESPGAPPAA